MKVFYVHHASREKNNKPSQNDNIKNIGREDAEVVAKLFLDAKQNGINIKTIYTSPYYRCKETAVIINRHVNVPIIEDERLNEFQDVHSMIKYGKSTKGAETWVECQNRIINCLKDIVNNNSNEDVVVCVTSGVNITAFISVAYKIKPSSDLPFPLVPSCSIVGFDLDKTSFDFLDN